MNNSEVPLSQIKKLIRNTYQKKSNHFLQVFFAVFLLQFPLTMSQVNPDTRKLIEAFQQCCVEMATNTGIFSYERYEDTRRDLILGSDARVLKSLPDWIINVCYGSLYWRFIKDYSRHHEPRRNFLNAEFAAVYNRLDNDGVQMTGEIIQNLLDGVSSDSVHAAWQKCFERRFNDPEGAITSSRTLVECTCKHILVQLGETPDESGDLPRLYKQTAKALNLAPSQQEEQMFKQVLGGCATIVDGISAIRNRLGDAHGHVASRGKATRRHAEFVVNLSGALSSFLISTYEENYKKVNA